ncbi:MAG: L,D-transpeptidase family protein, partial [Pseudomonadota bacterium]
LDRARLNVWYKARQFKLTWVKLLGPSVNALYLRDVLGDADRDALFPEDYHSDAVRELWTKKDAGSLVRLDLLLTDAFLRYAVEVRAGYQFPRAIDPDWYIVPDKIDPLALLKGTLEKKDFAAAMAQLPPAYDEYKRLRQALKVYRRWQKQGEWPILRDETALRAGDWSPMVATLRERLEREGFLRVRVDANEMMFDAEVEQAVKQFQSAHGFTPDGVVGRGTRAALNVSLAARVAEIEKNMERWRWMPRKMESRNVQVNMADYKLAMMDKGKKVLEMRVVVGKDYRATPVFNNKIQYIELNPVWKVPDRIAREDLLPKQRQDPEYFLRKGIHVVTSWGSDGEEIDIDEIDWENVKGEDFPYKLQQESGGKNSLGRMKFMFPNSFRVYLHDTPARFLFERRIRTYSSGCIRVEQPVELAAQLLASPQWSVRDVEAALATAQTQRVDLAKPTPIYLLYWTAWVENERVQFRPDIYGRNRALPDHRLYKAAKKIASTR